MEEIEHLLISKTVEIQIKPFSFDLKENPRTQYLLISEKLYSRKRRPSILVPSVSAGISSFLAAFASFIADDASEDDQNRISGMEFQILDRVFSFSIGRNGWGRFMKVTETLAGKNNGCIIIPSGSSGDEGLEAFRGILAEIDRTARVFFPPLVQPCDPPKQVLEAPDVTKDCISGHDAQNSSSQSSQSSEEAPEDEPSRPDFGDSKTEIVTADQKKFVFHSGTNWRGDFLKIQEVTYSNRTSIIVPLAALKQFYDTIGHFLELNHGYFESKVLQR